MLFFTCRKRKRRSNSGPSSSRAPIVPSQPKPEVSIYGDSRNPWAPGDRDGACPQALLGSLCDFEYATELSTSPGKVMKICESPCPVQSCEEACSPGADCVKLTSCISTVSDSAEHCCSKSDSKSGDEVAVNVLDSLLNTSHLVKSDNQPPRAELSDAHGPQQCAGSSKVSDASFPGTIGSLANHNTFHQPTSPAGLGSVTIEDSFHVEKQCGSKIASSAPIPGQELGQTLEDLPCQYSTELKYHDCRKDDSTFETQQDDLLDELFGIQKVNPSTKNDMAEELLCGLCPEDLDSTLNTSMLLESAKDEGCTSPWYHGVKSPNLADIQATPSRFKMQGMTSGRTAPHSMIAKTNVQLSTSEQTGGVCGEVANVEGSSSTAVVPGSEVSSTKGVTSTLSAPGDGVQQVRRGEGRGGGGGGWDTLHCYPDGTFYGLPLEVQACIKEHKGIVKLYGRHVIFISVRCTQVTDMCS